jgi:hypothetical protein
MENQLDTLKRLEESNPSAYLHTKDIVIEEFTFLANDMISNASNYFDNESIMIPMDLQGCSVVNDWIEDMVVKAIQETILDMSENIHKIRLNNER